MSLNNTTEVNAPMSNVDMSVSTTYSKRLFDEANAIQRALEADEEASEANKKLVNIRNEVDRLTTNLYNDNVSGYTLVANLRSLGFAVQRTGDLEISACKATQQASKLWDIANKLTARRIAEYKTNHKCDTVNSQLELTCVSVSSNNE
jgi:hypothetical protein